jgi:predicted metal-dependent hydrolase
MISYETLKAMSGEKCYTLTRDNPADMYVDDQGVTVVYPSGRSIDLPREMVIDAINWLRQKRELTVDEVHEEITKRNRTRTDKLMAVLRKLPGVRFRKYPRVLYYQEG